MREFIFIIRKDESNNYGFNGIGRLEERSRDDLDKRNRNSRIPSWCNIARSIVRLFTGTLLFLQDHVPECATPWPSKEDAPPRGTPVWIIYSGCVPREEGGNFRGAVLRWLRSFIASSPPYHLLHSLPSSPPFLPPACYSAVSLRPPLAHPHPFVAILHQNLFVPRREKRGSTRCYTLGSNLRTAGATQTNARCARREGVRRIFVFAHSRANVHPSSCGEIFRRGLSAELFHRNEGHFLFTKDSSDRILILYRNSNTLSSFVIILHRLSFFRWYFI